MTKPTIPIIALLPSLALAEPLPQPKPPGSGVCPHGYTSSGSFCVPREGAQDPAATERHLSVGLDSQRQLLPAQRQRADRELKHVLKRDVVDGRLQQQSRTTGKLLRVDLVGEVENACAVVLS